MPHERSQYGCWTCRIRKKKCDETPGPTCCACYSRGITCHGYGPKPQWMDGAEKERKEVENLKRAVKENLKQKKALAQPPNESVQYAILSTPSSESMDGTKLSYYSPEMAVVMTPPISLHTYPHSTGQCSSPPQQNDHVILVSPQTTKDYEATMLMNYLDHVFPLQFNCYMPPVVELGRGWLLALLTRTKPLYHAALALSCFYMRSELLKTTQGQSRCIIKQGEKMNAHHALAFQELQVQISASKDGEKEGNMKENIEILACIVQLISFELLRGGTDSWPIHLEAASSMVPALTALRKTLPGTASYIERFERGDQYSIVDEIACDFLVSVFVWFDIVASASTRSKHFLENNVQYLGNIELDKVMGCESSVMILISKISQLEEWKREMQLAGTLSMVELSSRGSEIEKLLNHGLARQTIHPCGPVLGNCPSRYVSTITRIFACAALTYLHTVVSGAHPELPEIKKSVSMTIAAFSNLPEPKLLQNLVWPFCITGCMASKDQDSLFRNLMTGMGVDRHSPGNYLKAFEVIQECWRLREDQDEASCRVDWTSAMSSLGFQVLLV